MTKRNGASVLIIPDGNGRWATRKGRRRGWGHIKGSHAVVNLIKALPDSILAHQVKRLTLFGAAIANFDKRDPKEMAIVCKVVTRFIKKHIDEFHARNCSIRFIGRRDRLPKNLMCWIDRAESLTKTNSGYELVIALDYASSWDIAEAAKEVARKVASGEILLAEIDELTMQRHLACQGRLTNLVLRSGMEENEGVGDFYLSRPSDIGLGDGPQAIWVSTSTLWPDCTITDLELAFARAGLDQQLQGGQRIAAE